MKNRKNNKQKVKKIVYAITIIILLILSFTFLMGNGTTSSHVDVSMKKIFVSAGETLWEIAETEAVNNTYYHNKDVRYIVKDIKVINNLKNSDLSIGQELVIPQI